MSTTLTYTLSGNNATITGYTGDTPVSLVIPNTIDGYPVVAISNTAFTGITSITSLSIGNNVTAIGNNTFQGCTGLLSVTIPTSVTNIGTVYSNCYYYNESFIDTQVPKANSRDDFTVSTHPVYANWDFTNIWVLVQGSLPDLMWEYNIWSGNGNWSNPSNWSFGTVPTSTSKVLFNNTSTSNCTIDTHVVIDKLRILSTYSGTITHSANFHSNFFQNSATAINYNYLYTFVSQGINLSQFTNPSYPLPYTITDVLCSNGDSQIEEIPLGTLNAPLDELWDVWEIGEMTWPPFPLYPPLDITMGKSEKDLLGSDLFLITERSYTFMI